MKNTEILKKAIQKAMDNGYKPFGDSRITLASTAVAVFSHITIDDKLVKEFYFVIIFNNDFARALWGSTPGTIFRQVDHNGHQRYGASIAEWQAHLQRMAIVDDPIKYLGENT